MTILSAPTKPVESATGTSTPEQVPALGASMQPRSPRTVSARLAVGSMASLILGALMVGLMVNLLLVSTMRHSRDQHVSYAQFRSALANAVAPTNVTDGNGALLPLGVPVAWIDAPSLGIDEVVLNGTTSTVLMSGPGHQRDTAMPGQAPMPSTGAVLPSLMLSPGESAMVGDPSAATGLLLWSALLLAAALLTVWLAIRWGRWQTWIVAVPVLAALGVAVTNHVAMLLPNLL